MQVLNEVLQTLIYPSIAAFAVAVLKLVLEWGKVQARAALNAAVQRAAGKILLSIGERENVGTVYMTETVTKLADQAEEILTTNFAQTLNKLGTPAPGTLSGMVQGEVGKLLAAKKSAE